jgi:hypothetical protein
MTMSMPAARAQMAEGGRGRFPIRRQVVGSGACAAHTENCPTSAHNPCWLPGQDGRNRHHQLTQASPKNEEACAGMVDPEEMSPRSPRPPRFTRQDRPNNAVVSRWCPRRDSNSHTLRRRILNPLRLPFRHSGHTGSFSRPPQRRQSAADYSFCAESVSQSATFPEASPRRNQLSRCAEVPWVKVCGIGR